MAYHWKCAATYKTNNLQIYDSLTIIDNFSSATHQTAVYPVMGLPNTLEYLLETLSVKDSVRSWQIYEERNGSVTVKIRFNGQNGGTDMNSKQVCYKRKSA